MQERILQLAADFLADQGVTYARMRGIVFVRPENSLNWISLFQDSKQRKAGLWKIDIERRLLSKDEIDSGNVFCIFIDPETGECAPFYPI